MRFTKCADVANYKCNNLVSQLKAENGLVQLLVDNYDQALSSMNCSKTGTHVLRMVITQYVSPYSEPTIRQNSTIPKLPRQKATDLLESYRMDIHHYVGLENPVLPVVLLSATTYSGEIIEAREIRFQRSKELDFTFLRKVSDVHSTDDACLYGGYVPKCAQESNKKCYTCNKENLHASTENATS